MSAGYADKATAGGDISELICDVDEWAVEAAVHRRCLDTTLRPGNLRSMPLCMIRFIYQMVGYFEV